MCRNWALVVGLASEEGEGSLCEEKRVHVSEILPVGGAVLFMRDEGQLRAELDLSLPGRWPDYCLAGAAALRELWLVAGAAGCADWPREADAFARATLRCHRQKGRKKLSAGERLPFVMVEVRDESGTRLGWRCSAAARLELTAFLPMPLPALPLDQLYVSPYALCPY
ncbi:hypothetical protein V8C42DRAFT_327889 [Trichoderma barbatum]